jgi:hypothetical protein
MAHCIGYCSVAGCWVAVCWSVSIIFNEGISTCIDGQHFIELSSLRLYGPRMNCWGSSIELLFCVLQRRSCWVQMSCNFISFFNDSRILNTVSCLWNHPPDHHKPRQRYRVRVRVRVRVGIVECSVAGCWVAVCWGVPIIVNEGVSTQYCRSTLYWKMRFVSYSGVHTEYIMPCNCLCSPPHF